jgi:hypothetical protein
MRPTLRRTRFTLTELLVVIAIIAIQDVVWQVVAADPQTGIQAAQ